MCMQIIVLYNLYHLYIYLFTITFTMFYILQAVCDWLAGSVDLHKYVRQTKKGSRWGKE